MNGVAKRVENGSEFIRNVRVYGPDVYFGNGNVLGKTTIGVDAQNDDINADVTVARTALFAMPASNMAFGTYSIANFCALNRISNRDNFADKFVPGRDADFHATLAPRIPLINVPIGSANSSMSDRYQNIAIAIFWDCDLRAPIQPGRVLQLPNGRHVFRKFCHP